MEGEGAQCDGPGPTFKLNHRILLMQGLKYVHECWEKDDEIGRFKGVGVAIPLHISYVFDYNIVKNQEAYINEYNICCLALVYFKPYDSSFIKFTPPPFLDYCIRPLGEGSKMELRQSSLIRLCVR